MAEKLEKEDWMMEATPTETNLPLRYEGFSSLWEALDYAAKGETGYNFYNGRGKLDAVVPYTSLKENAQQLALRLLGLKVERGARVAIVADTHPDFLRVFFACQYAGLVPVPLPATFHLGGHRAYTEQLRRLLVNCQASIAVAPPNFVSFLVDAADGLNLRYAGSTEQLADLPASSQKLKPSTSKELAYLQYTSGSTRFPRAVMITQEAVINNLYSITKFGAKTTPEDRIMSWLPFYHDMGLVGLVLTPLVSQRSVDYLGTRDFAMRPRLWLKLISQNRSTVSFSPPFGYELCVKRLKPDDISTFDLHSWRLAGVGAETIRPEPLLEFSEILAPAGFNKNALVACYGMAECSLAVSFAPLNEGIHIDYVQADPLADHNQAISVPDISKSKPAQLKRFVVCGKPLPDYDVEIRDENGHKLPDRHCGTLFVKGPSLMSGYLGEEKLSHEILSPEGWLNTGDLAYLMEDRIVITGREKDLIIINGRNIWPQDMEYIAEQQPELRTGDTSAFSVPGPNGEDIAILAVECRQSNEASRTNLVNRLQGDIRKELGIDCFIELVTRNTLPRTTSGKLSRSRAREDFLKRVKNGQTLTPLMGTHGNGVMKKAV
jgi:fatty-acyl-CoA synthase